MKDNYAESKLCLKWPELLFCDQIWIDSDPITSIFPFPLFSYFLRPQNMATLIGGAIVSTTPSCCDSNYWGERLKYVFYIRSDKYIIIISYLISTNLFWSNEMHLCTWRINNPDTSGKYCASGVILQKIFCIVNIINIWGV